MVEPLFGSVSQFWPAMPAPAFGFVQSPMASSAPPLRHHVAGMPTGPAPSALSAAPTSNPMPVDPYAFAGGVMPVFAGPSVGAGFCLSDRVPIATTVPH